jgi:hypothetical protein
MNLIFFLAVALLGAFGWVVLRTRRNETIAPLPEVEPARPGEGQLDRLLSDYRLSERSTEFFGKWKETSVDGIRVAFLGTPELLNIEVGDFNPDEEQLSDIYLGVTHSDQPQPATDPRGLAPFVGPNGRALAERFQLNATGGTEYPQLCVHAIRDSLVALSDKVDEVAFYESGGFSLRCVNATRHSVAADFDQSRGSTFADQHISAGQRLATVDFDFSGGCVLPHHLAIRQVEFLRSPAVR